MKVSTDACIQGAWTPLPTICRKVLDLGAGTGLLSLMIAQRAKEAEIVVLEIEADAVAQATENIVASPYASRVRAVHADATQWECSDSFDLIICNPPFFKNALHGPDPQRNQARHIAGLDAACLVQLVLEWLSQEGLASFLWPPEMYHEFVKLAGEKGLYLQRQLSICHRAGGRVGRMIGIFGRQKIARAEKIN